MPKIFNEKCFECSKVPRHVFRMNHPDCYHASNCRRMRSYYRNYDVNKLKQSKWHKWRQFKTDRCFVCDSKDNLECHHIHARVDDKDDVEENVVTLCLTCHSVITRFERKLGYGKNRNPRWKVAIKELDSPDFS